MDLACFLSLQNIRGKRGSFLDRSQFLPLELKQQSRFDHVEHLLFSGYATWLGRAPSLDTYGETIAQTVLPPGAPAVYCSATLR